MKKYKLHSLRRKVAPRNVLLELSTGLKKIESLKKKPDEKWNKRSGDLKTRYYIITLQNCEKKLKENLASQEKHPQKKPNANEVEKEGQASVL